MTSRYLPAPAPPAATSRRGAPPPTRVGDAAWRRRVRALVDQQLWCLGVDVRHPDGNQLLTAGFTRHRCAEGTVGATAYARTDANRTLLVWGFGVWAGAPGLGSVFLDRRDPWPLRWQASAEPPLTCHHQHELRPWRTISAGEPLTHAMTLTVGLAEALAAYEAMIVTTLGAAYRHDVLRQAPRAPITPTGMAAAWRAVADRLTLQLSASCSRPAA